MADKTVSPWAVVKRLLHSGQLLSVANRPHCRTLNLTYELHNIQEIQLVYDLRLYIV